MFISPWLIVQKSMYKELSHSDTTTTQEVLTLDHQRTTKLNNSKDSLIIEKGVSQHPPPYTVKNAG